MAPDWLSHWHVGRAALVAVAHDMQLSLDVYQSIQHKGEKYRKARGEGETLVHVDICEAGGTRTLWEWRWAAG